MLAASAALKLVLCAGQLKLATVGFTQVGLSEAQAGFYAEHFSVQLQRVDEQGVRITTPKDMATLLGVEKQKQLLGCADDSSSCMAELAGALGADGLVTGQIAKVGQSLQLNVKILAADGSKTLFIHSSKLLRTEEELIEELNTVAVKAVEHLKSQAVVAAAVSGGGEAPAGTVAAPGPSRSKLKLIPGGVGLVAVALGIGGLGVAGDQYSHLNTPARWEQPRLDAAGARALRDEGTTNLAVGITLVSVGVVLIIGGLLWYLLS